MSTTRIRMVRGTISRSTKTVNQRFDLTEVETITLELNTGMVFKEVSAFDAQVYSIDGDRVTKEVFVNVLKLAGHDWGMLEKALYKKVEKEARKYQKGYYLNPYGMHD